MAQAAPQRRRLFAVGLLLLASALVRCDVATAAVTPHDWREKAADIRILAENNAPRAYTQAQRLQAELPAAAAPADKARMLNLLARIEIYLAHTEISAQHAGQALELARQNGDRVGQAEANLNIALSAINQGNIKGVGDATMSALTLLDGVARPDLLGEAMLRTGMVYRRQGQIAASVTMAWQALEIAQRADDPLALAYAEQGLGIAFEHSGHYAEARDHFLQMGEHARAAHSRQLEAHALLGRSNAMLGLGDFVAAAAMAKEAIALFRSIGQPFNTNFGLFALANVERRLGHRKNAAALLNEMLDTYRRHPNPIGEWWALGARSDDRLALGHIAAASADAEQAYALAKQIGLPYYVAESANRMAAITHARGDHPRAYDLAVEALAMTARVEKEKSGEDMLKITERYRSESKQREIEELKRRAERQAVHERWLWTMIGAGLFILAGTLFFASRLRRSHRLLGAANAELRRTQQEIEQLNIGLERQVAARTAELHRSQRVLAEAERIAHIGSWEVDHVRKLHYWSDELFRIYEIDPKAEGASDKGCLDATHPDDRAAVERAFNDALAAGAPYEHEHRLLFPDGRIKHVYEYCDNYFDADGKPLRSVGMMQDITERKGVEAARNVALAEAEHLARARSKFLAQMSHELRTPLNGILGYAQVLQRTTALDARQKAGLGVIEHSADQLLTIINDILDFAKIEAGKAEAVPSDIRLHEFLRSVADSIGLRAEQKGLLFVCDIAPDLPAAIRADERLLRQALLNLLANAIRFTDRGEVGLRATFAPPDRLRLAVSDTGIGIDMAQTETLFQPFEQASDSRWRPGGTGLGLAISRHFVHLMGGDIRVDSRVGAGSTFWIELPAPAVADALVPATDHRIVTGYAGPRKRILVAEDLPETRALIADMLEPLGFDLTLTANGRECLEQLQAHKPDLLLVDIVMPEFDGHEITRRLRQTPGLDMLPIVAISASATALDRENSIALGANDFLAKPVALDRLLACIGALLDIEWLRAAPGPAPAPARQTGAALVAPPREEMTTLHRLALQGNMGDILRHADALLALDARYHPFAAKLRQLATSYQSKAILNLVEQHLERNRTQ